MRRAYRVETVRAAEQALMKTVPAGALMQRAAAGLAATCAGLLARRPGHVYGARVTVLAGSGDNGGDALYAGAMLARRGVLVTAIAPGDKVHEGGLGDLRAAGGRILRQAPDSISGADLVIDGMLGIGGRGGLREPYATLAGLSRQARQDGATLVAVDLPSGIDADTGVVGGPAVSAEVTVTFGAIKPGLLIDPGASHAGTVHLIDIGLGPYLSQPAAVAPQHADISALLPRPGPESDKYRRGVVGLLAGSDRFGGAVVLATGGAIRGGAGMVRVVTAPGPAQAVRQTWPEAVVTAFKDDDEPAAGNPIATAGRVQAWVAGPGMGTTDAAGGRLAAVLGTSVPVLVDADGLTLLVRMKGLAAGRTAPTLITPHAGELARLIGADPAHIEAGRLEHASRAAAELKVTVLLKGSTTVVASPDGPPVLVNPTGTPALATAGSGDVLSGLAGALLAQGLAPAEAALAAAYLHGLAGRLAASGHAAPGSGPAGETTSEAPIGASDVVRALPDAFRAVG
jgi:hydroxyethylthiazole kinase-like uncharacterized protein yjeF